MTDTLAARPVPLSRVWSGRDIIAEDVEGDDLGDVVNLHADASAWWVLPRQGAGVGAHLREAARALDLDELAVHDLTAEDGRAKFEDLPNTSRLVATNAVTVDRDTVDLAAQPLSMIVTDRALICLVDRSASNLDPARLLAERSAQLAEGGLELALQLVVNEVLKTYEVAVEWLQDETEALSDVLFEGKPFTRDQQIRAFRLRRALGGLRRLTEPMLGVMKDLGDSRPADAPATRRWKVLEEQHSRVATTATGLTEALRSMFETSLSLADLRMNEVMKQLTSWAAIIAVPTLITGFAGQNVNFPLDGTATGFWLYLALQLVSSVVLYVWFKRKGWI